MDSLLNKIKEADTVTDLLIESLKETILIQESEIERKDLMIAMQSKKITELQNLIKKNEIK